MHTFSQKIISGWSTKITSLFTIFCCVSSLAWLTLQQAGCAQIHRRLTSNTATCCREVVEKFEAEGRHDDGTCRNARKACGSVQCCVRRIYDKKCFESLKFVGPALSNKVQHSLWAQFPPDPPTQEEQEAWAAATNPGPKVCGGVA